MSLNVRCANCGDVMGTYFGKPYYILAEETIGGCIVYIGLGSDDHYITKRGNVGAKFLCIPCLGEEHPGTIGRE
jgi:hypothetical protein